MVWGQTQAHNSFDEQPNPTVFGLKNRLSSGVTSTTQDAIFHESVRFAPIEFTCKSPNIIILDNIKAKFARIESRGSLPIISRSGVVSTEERFVSRDSTRSPQDFTANPEFNDFSPPSSCRMLRPALRYPSSRLHMHSSPPLRRLSRKYHPLLHGSQGI